MQRNTDLWQHIINTYKDVSQKLHSLRPGYYTPCTLLAMTAALLCDASREVT